MYKNVVQRVERSSKSAVWWSNFKLLLLLSQGESLNSSLKFSLLLQCTASINCRATVCTSHLAGRCCCLSLNLYFCDFLVFLYFVLFLYPFNFVLQWISAGRRCCCLSSANGHWPAASSASVHDTSLFLYFFIFLFFFLLDQLVQRGFTNYKEQMLLLWISAVFLSPVNWRQSSCSVHDTSAQSPVKCESNE